MALSHIISPIGARTLAPRATFFLTFHNLPLTLEQEMYKARILLVVTDKAPIDAARPEAQYPQLPQPPTELEEE